MLSMNGLIMLAVVISSSRVPASPFANNFEPKKIIGGDDMTCALSKQGHIKCWGSNSFGDLGVGTPEKHGLYSDTMGAFLPVVNIGDGVLAQDMCAGYGQTCALTTTGKVKCWGANYRGQLGQERDIVEIGRSSNQMGDNLPFTNLGEDFVAKDIQCGGAFVCALSTAGKVKCWGDGSLAQLGVNISPNSGIGRKENEMGAKLPYLALPTPVTQITTGGHHACAVANDTIYCWGNNNYGQIGLERNADMVYLPTESDSPKPTVTLEDQAAKVTVESVRAGDHHTCALYKASTGGLPARQKLKCWGSNNSGALGIGNSANVGRLPNSMGANLPEINLGLSDIAQIEPHVEYTCALTRQRLVKCWGYNIDGQLGLEDRKHRGTSPEHMGTNLPYVDINLPILTITKGAASWTTCALLVNHEIKCWGYGGEGALGYEDNVSHGGTEDDMGENLPYVRFK